MSTETPTERRRRLFQDWETGLNGAEIARREGISRQRVHQLISGFPGYESDRYRRQTVERVRRRRARRVEELRGRRCVDCDTGIGHRHSGATRCRWCIGYEVAVTHYRRHLSIRCRDIREKRINACVECRRMFRSGSYNAKRCSTCGPIWYTVSRVARMRGIARESLLAEYREWRQRRFG